MWFKKAPFFPLLVAISLSIISSLAIAASDYEIVEWTDLMPPIDLAAFENQVIDHGDGMDSSSTPLSGQGLEPGSEQDSFEEDAYQSALRSTRTVDAFNGKDIKLAGFIVPLEFDDDLTITQFFLVPYFGACIHLPAPPPNQMILVDYPEGLKLNELYTPFWISGELSIQVVENDMGTSAYAMKMESLEVYDY